MSGNIRALSMHQAIFCDYSNCKTWRDPGEWKLVNGFIEEHKGDTLVFIYSIYQNPDQVKVFKEAFKDYIIFESKPSVNGSAGHGGIPRNTLVIVDIPK